MKLTSRWQCSAPGARFLRFLVALSLLAGGFFYTQGVGAQAQKPDLRIIKAAFDGLNLHVEYVNATGVGYPRVRYEVGFQWYDVNGSALGTRHWLNVPEVERGGVSILDNKYRIDLTYRGRDGRNYNRTLAEFLYQRPDKAEELRVMVDDGDRVSETDESNNIARLRIPLPDLQITGAKFLSPNKLELSYRNANPSPIPLPFRMGFTWAEEGGAYANATRWINVLEPAAGETKTEVLSRTDASYITASGRQAGDRLDWYFERRPGNAKRLQVTIDDAGTVREVNEQNNLVSVRPFLPDLVVRDATLDEDRLTFTYGNAGEGTIRDVASRVLFQWVGASEKPIGEPRWHRFAQMDPGQTFTVDADRFDVEYAIPGTNRTATQRLGAYVRQRPQDAARLAITIDDERLLVEANEQNNATTVTPPPPPQPDLTITDAVLTIDEFGFTVRNLGSGATPPGQPTSLWFEWVDVTGARVGALAWADVRSAIGSGQTFRFSAGGAYERFTRFTRERTGGGTELLTLTEFLADAPEIASHLKVHADGPNAIRESNEANNIALLARPPRPMADLVVEDASTDHGSLALTYRNAGERMADSHSIWLHFADAQGNQIGPLYWMDVAPLRAGTTRVLADETNTAFSSAGTIDFTALFTRPPDGATHLKVLLDGPNAIVETNEGNNAVLLEKPVIPMPDLTIVDLTRTADGSFTWKVKNLGDTPPEQRLLGPMIYYAYELQWLRQDGTPIGTPYRINSGGALPTGATLSHTNANFTATRTPPSGAAKLRVTVDSDNAVLERNEQNNTAEAELAIPDLTIVDLVRTADGYFTWKVKNLGDTPPEQRLVGPMIYYAYELQWLRQDNTPLGSPHHINSGGPLPTGATLSHTNANFTATRTPPSGAAKLRVTVDSDNAVLERNEQNNTAEAELAIPDLTIVDLVRTADGSFTWKVKNIGDTPPEIRLLGPMIYYAYELQWLRQDNTPLGSPHHINSGGPLPTGATLSHTNANFTATRTPPSGAAKLRVTVDSDNAVLERNEQNNTAEVPVMAPFLVDLVIANASLTPSGLTLVYQNTGNSTTAPISIWLHFVDASGAQVGPLYWVDVSSLNAGQFKSLANEARTAYSSEGAIEFRDLLTSAPRTATHLKVLLDGPDRIVEADEKNNAALLPIPVIPRPDFTITDPRVDADGTIHFTVRNIGTAGVTSLRVRGQWVQADGEIIIGGDRIFSMSAVDAGFVSEQVAQSILPDIFPAPDAAAKLRLIADPIGRFGELNEENNILEIALPPRVPDLAITDLALTADQATWKLRNIGDPLPSTQALTFVVEFQWLDQAGAPVGPSAGINSDIFFPTPSYVHNRSSGYSGSASSDYILRRPAGAARIRVTEDSTNVIREKDETNNVAEATVPLPPPPPQPDLMFARTALIPDAPDPRIDYILENAGTADTTGGVLELQWLTADGKPIGPAHAFVTYGLLKPGDRATRGLLMQDSGPKPGQTGRYLLLPPEDATHLRLKLDPENAIAESDETNNVAVLVRPPAIPLSDLTVTAAKLTLDAFALTYQNAGSVRAGLGAPLSTWFEWVDASGGRVGELVWHDGETLPPKYRTQIEGETKVSSASRSNFPLREFLAAPPDGATHLKVSLDGPNALLESNEANNVARLVRQTVPLPDLRISIFSIDPIAPRAGERVWFIVRVENIGRASSGQATATGIILDPTNDGKGQKLIGQFTTENIPSGQSKTLRWTKENYYGWVAVTGTHTIEVCADRAKVVPEEDEINNCAKKEVTVAATVDEQSKLPDLTIINATLDTAAFRFWYHNLGETATASASISLWYELVDAQGKRVSELRWINVNAVMPAKSKQQGNQLLDFATLDSERGKITLGNFVNSAPPSATHLKLTIDGPNAHAEANEQNNSVLLPIPKLAALNLPDLALTAGVRAGGVVRLAIVNGTANSIHAPLLQFKWLDAKGATLSTSPVSYWQHETIGSGKTGDFTIEYEKWREDGVIYFLKHPPSAAVALLAMIDPENKLKESNEDNNAFRIALSQPDLAVEGTPALTLSLAVEIIKSTTAAASSSATAGFLLALAALVSGGFLIHAHHGTLGGARGLLSVFPLLLTSAESSYMRLRNCGPEGCVGSHFARHGALKRLTRASLGVALATGLVKLGLALAFTAVAGPAESALAVTPEASPGDGVRATLMAKNTGSVPATGIILRLPCPAGTAWLNTRLDDREDRRNAALGLTVADLAVGASHRLAVVCKLEQSVLTSVRFVGDAQMKATGDRRWSSNIVEVAVRVAAVETVVKPDLTVAGIGLLPLTEIVEADRAPFEAVVSGFISNKGKKNSGVSRSRVRLDQGGQGTWDVISPMLIETPALAASAETLVKFPLEWQAPVGNYTIEICVDPGKNIDESNETNNCATERFTLKVGEEPIFEEGLPE